MGYYWLCGKRKRMSGCPVLVLLPQPYLLGAMVPDVGSGETLFPGT